MHLCEACGNWILTADGGSTTVAETTGGPLIWEDLYILPLLQSPGTFLSLRGEGTSDSNNILALLHIYACRAGEMVIYRQETSIGDPLAFEAAWGNVAHYPSFAASNEILENAIGMLAENSNAGII